jgi:hypothetical protein
MIFDIDISKIVDHQLHFHQVIPEPLRQGT